MKKNQSAIPVNSISDHFDLGIAIEKLIINPEDEATLNASDQTSLAHREDRHSFFLLKRGTVQIEIDFQEFVITAPSIVYMHPDQVHRILKLQNVTVGSFAINNERLSPEYVTILNSLNSSKPLKLNRATFDIVFETFTLCDKFLNLKNYKLHNSLVKDSCNALVALAASQFLKSEQTGNPLQRFKVISDNFKLNLENSFLVIKSPSIYAQKLNISSHYLNECVKKATGISVSQHILQRTILEAKRLLYHSQKSIKEISSILGYDDYPYFSKVFTRSVGMTPLAFRNTNHE